MYLLSFLGVCVFCLFVLQPQIHTCICKAVFKWTAGIQDQAMCWQMGEHLLFFFIAEPGIFLPLRRASFARGQALVAQGSISNALDDFQMCTSLLGYLFHLFENGEETSRAVEDERKMLFDQQVLSDLQHQCIGCRASKFRAYTAG